MFSVKVATYTTGNSAGQFRMRRHLMTVSRVSCLLAATLLPVCTLAKQAPPDTRALIDLSLEDLANLEITSVAKKEAPLSDAPASLFVITANDIRRTGATSLPEALRLAPNLQVAKVDANRYAISARGFNGTVSNKLQVLIDGRIVYTPLYSGVFWDAQDVMLDDVERIEVISGPAAALWGANAVNGVINVITRDSEDTQRALMEAGGGNREKNLAFRYGGALGNNGHYRVYGKFTDRENSERANGNALDDRWHRSQVGFRVDLGDASQGIQIQGDAYTGRLEQTAPGTREIAGANLMVHWRRQLASGDGFKLHAYHDYTERDFPGIFAEHLHTTHLDFLYSLRKLNRHQIQWGLDYRYARERIDNGEILAFLPAKKNLSWTSLYGQDEIQLRENLNLTVNARIERNDYTGTELMPAIRLAWKLREKQLIWSAVSRAVRTPSRIDREFFVPGQQPFLLEGGPDFDSEIADVYEVGYRALPLETLSWSLTVFHADYDHLRTLEPTAGAFIIDNGLEGSHTGVETWGSYQATEDWRLIGGFTALRQSLHLKPGSADINDGKGESNDPSHQWLLRSQLNLGSDREFDLTVRRVGALPHPEVPSYVAVDFRLGWRLSADVEWSLIAQNILDRRHPEFGSSPERSEIQRSIYLSVKWNF